MEKHILITSTDPGSEEAPEKVSSYSVYSLSVSGNAFIRRWATKRADMGMPNARVTDSENLRRDMSWEPKKIFTWEATHKA